MSGSISCEKTESQPKKGRLKSRPFCFCYLAALTQGFDADFQWRGGHQQASPAAFEATVDAERGQAVRHGDRHFLLSAQTLQSGDHGTCAGQACTSFVGLELALTREPHNDDAGQDAQNKLGEDGGNEVTDAWAVFVLQHDLINKVAEDPCEEHHEGV